MIHLFISLYLFFSTFPRPFSRTPIRKPKKKIQNAIARRCLQPSTAATRAHIHRRRPRLRIPRPEFGPSSRGRIFSRPCPRVRSALPASAAAVALPQVPWSPSPGASPATRILQVLPRPAPSLPFPAVRIRASKSKQFCIPITSISACVEPCWARVCS
jgi:hypothetical protein